DGNLIEARKKRRIKNPSHSNIETISDLGFIGEPTMINPDVLIAFEESDLIPIIAPIGIGENGETYYLNPDQVAAALASSLAACKLLILTDSHGLLTESSDLIENITVNRARQLISEGAVSKEMLSKVEACISALENHTGSAHILDGRIEHALLLEIFTSQRVGTMFSRE
ncbi:MAG: acetylglutamate kinase, partial [Pseudomonadota bacterium]